MFLRFVFLSVCINALPILYAGSPTTPKHTPSEEVKCDSIKIKPHTAEYKITLVKNNNPDVQDVVGSLVITIKESDGYISEQHALLEVRYNDGSKDEYETFLASWESKDEKRYHFNLKTSQNKEEEFSIRGKAKMDTSKGEVTYQIPENQKVDLPVGTVFPMKLLKNLIEDGIAKKTSRSSLVFDGSNETFKPIQVDAVIQPTHSKIKINGSSDISFDEAFLLQMAVYDPNDKNMDPAYVTSQVVQKDGIIISLEMEFPEIGFTTKAQLVKVSL